MMFLLASLRLRLKVADFTDEKFRAAGGPLALADALCAFRAEEPLQVDDERSQIALIEPLPARNT